MAIYIRALQAYRLDCNTLAVYHFQAVVAGNQFIGRLNGSDNLEDVLNKRSTVLFLGRFDMPRWAFYYLILTVFTFPLSSCLKSIFLALTTWAVLVQSDMRSDLIKVCREPWCVAMLFFFALVVICSFFGDADWESKLAYINKYSKLLYLPFLALLFRDKTTRHAAAHVFLLAMLVTFVISVLKIFGWADINSPGDAGAVFQNHITTGYFMAFSAYISALYSWKYNGVKRWCYAALALLFSFHTIFINTGRTGYVSFAILVLVFLLQCISLRKLPLYLCLLLPPVVLIVHQSTSFNHGIHFAIKDARTYASGNKNTSVGFRLQFSQYAKKLFYTSPVLGLGTAGFSYQFGKDKPMPAWGDTLGDPHNQYLLTAVEYGVIGLVLLLFFFFSIAYASYKTQKMNSLMPGLFISFLVANFADSFLLISATGYFFVIFSAIVLGESLESSARLSREEVLPLARATC